MSCFYLPPIAILPLFVTILFDFFFVCEINFLQTDFFIF